MGSEKRRAHRDSRPTRQASKKTRLAAKASAVTPQRRQIAYDRIVALPDLHEPYRDDSAFHAALDFVGRIRPAVVVILGDWIDFYQLSRFVKDPGRKLELQADLDTASRSLRSVRRAAPRARICFLRGNHEYRLTKHLWGTESPLASLRGLRVPELLGFSEHGIEYAESGQIEIGHLRFKHGNVVRQKSGMTALAELDRAWHSGVSAHTHRLGHVYRTIKARLYTWIESGCLCGLDPEYAEGQAMDWQHGLVYAEVERQGGQFRSAEAAIVNGRVVFGGRELNG